MNGNELDFSFSGSKPLSCAGPKQHDIKAETEARRQLIKPEHSKNSLRHHSASHPRSARQLPTHRHRRTAPPTPNPPPPNRSARNRLIVAGGVACNAGLRKAGFSTRWTRFYFPTLNFSTDNAAMIAAAAYPKFRASQDFAGFDLKAQGRLDASFELESHGSTQAPGQATKAADPRRRKHHCRRIGQRRRG